ncbi:7083_t:CDS:10 [Entrophospora sp. SA101]|nr:7083_t:CDS:10 [Entrophospora sp. SA101]
MVISTELKNPVNYTGGTIVMLNPAILDKKSFIKVTEILEKKYGSDVAYSLVRLTRGLASPRAGARHGFALALTELLASLDSLEYREIADGSDVIYGRIFGYLSIIRSGLIWRKYSDSKDYFEVIDELITCSKSKPYVKETCYHIIISTIPHLKNSTKFENKALEHLLIVLQNQCIHGINNPDDLNLALSIEINYPEVVDNDKWKKIILHECKKCEGGWSKPQILHIKNIEKLSTALQAKSIKDPTNNIHQNQENKFHSVWETVFQYLISQSQSTLSESSKSKSMNKFITLEVLWEETSSLFSHNLMRSLINNVSDHDRYLHEAAIHALDVIKSVAIEDKRKAVVILCQLFKSTNYNDFDKITKTQIVKNIFMEMDDKTLENYVEYLKKLFLRPIIKKSLSGEDDDTNVGDIERYRQWCINHLYTLLKDPRVKHYQYEIPNPELTEEIQEICRTRFYNALSELSTPRQSKNVNHQKRKRKSLNNNDVIIMDDDEKKWVNYAVCLMKKLDNNTQVEPLIILNEEGKSIKELVISLLDKITLKLKKLKCEEQTKKNIEAIKKLEGFSWLFSFGTLTLYNEPVEALTALEEKEDEGEDEKSHNPVDVIIDLLLGFLAKPSAFLHNMATHAFRIFCGDITKSSLDLILDSDTENDDESDDDQDEKMERFDEKLSEIFKTKKKELAKKIEAKAQKLHFKHKIIGLLKIFVQEQSKNPLIFELFVPLLEFTRNAKTNEISKSVYIFLKTRVVVIKDGPTVELVDDDRLLEIMQQVQEIAHKSKYKDMMVLSWSLTMEIYESSYERFKTTKSSSLTIGMFLQLPGQFPQFPWNFTKEKKSSSVKVIK